MSHIQNYISFSGSIKFIIILIIFSIYITAAFLKTVYGRFRAVSQVINLHFCFLGIQINFPFCLVPQRIQLFPNYIYSLGRLSFGLIPLAG